MERVVLWRPLWSAATLGAASAAIAAAYAFAPPLVLVTVGPIAGLVIWGEGCALARRWADRTRRPSRVELWPDGLRIGARFLRYEDVRGVEHVERRRSVAVPVSDYDVKGSAKWSLVEGTVVLSLHGDAPEVVIETCHAWAEKDTRGAELAASLQRRLARP